MAMFIMMTVVTDGLVLKTCKYIESDAVVRCLRFERSRVWNSVLSDTKCAV